MYADFSFYDSIIFDYDNTIAKIPIDWIEARRDYKIFLDSNFPDLEIDPNMRVDEMERSALLKYPHQDNLVFSFRNDLESSLAGNHEVIPETIELIRNLESKELFIISNNLRNTVVGGLGRFGLTSMFKRIIGVDDVGMPKPSPRAWELLLETDPGVALNSLFVGDNDTTDGAFSKNAGIPFYNINNSDSK
jgi:HAD superfamily hydrolase (TIGR01549 family)